MEKRIIFLLLIIWVNIFVFVNYIFAQEPTYFNPFQYGIKTVKGVYTLTDNKLRDEIRKKAAELLNSYYGTSTFNVQGEKIISNNPNIDINRAVKDAYGGWRNLLKEATELVFASSTILFNLNLQKYENWQVVNLEITPDGELEKIYIAPAEYIEGFPVVSPCTKGIGQCILFIFDRGLRILYTLSLALGVLLLMWAGILYITKPTESSKIHQRVQWGVLGIVVSIASFTIVIALERWIAGGLPTTPSEVSYTTEPTSPEVKDITETENVVYIRHIEASNNNISIIYDYSGNLCYITLTATDDKGKFHKIDINREVPPGRLSSLNFPYNFQDISSLSLNFEPGSPNPCKTNVSKYLVKIGERVEISGPIISKPKLIIDQTTARIDENGKFAVFVIPKGGKCNLTYTFFNLTKGTKIGSGISIDNINLPNFIEGNLAIFGDKVSTGDTVRVIFNSQNCDLNIASLDLVYRKPSGAQPEEKLPELKIAEDRIRIYASQYIRLEMPDNLKDALEQLLGFAVLQRNIYQPPFSIYIEYDVEPADRNGSCTLYGVMRGTSVLNLSADKTKAVSLYVFNKDFQITLNYEKNKKHYIVSRYISPPSNTLGFLYIKFYDYSGRCEVKNLFERVFDIETGKVYLPGGSGWNIIKDILGL